MNKQFDPTKYPEELAELMAETEADIDELYDALLYFSATNYTEEEIERELDFWYADMLNILARFIMASFMLGAGVTLLSRIDLVNVLEMVSRHNDYLDNFTNDIRTRLVDNIEKRRLAPRVQIEPPINPLQTLKWRAEMYAQSITEAFWRGRNRDYPALPAYPGDGTSRCLTRCYCRWLWTTEDFENGNFDVVWRLGEAEHCQTCIARAKIWNPLRIRNWIIQDE